MPFKIVRNDLTKMQVDAIVNTANKAPIYSYGIDSAVYKAAGEEELLKERRKIGYMKEGEAAITSGFQLPAKYIIHAVSPLYINGLLGEERKLRACYRKSLLLAYKNGCKSIAFPLIATGGFRYPKEEGMRIAVDEINTFLLKHEMLVYLVVFDTKSTELALRLQPALEAYIDHHYVCEKREEEYGDRYYGSIPSNAPGYDEYRMQREAIERRTRQCPSAAPMQQSAPMQPLTPSKAEPKKNKAFDLRKKPVPSSKVEMNIYGDSGEDFDFLEVYQSVLDERMKHMTDTFQEYLFYLIQLKGMSNPEVYKRSIITKQTFAKIKKNPNYHPDKTTAMRLCVGARLSLDETKDLLARAGYALSPCDKRDIIFQFFIENEAYDMIAIDIALEEHGLPCFIE